MTEEFKVAKDCEAELTTPNGTVLCNNLLTEQEIRTILDLLNTCAIKFEYAETASEIAKKLKVMMVAQAEVEHQANQKK